MPQVAPGQPYTPTLSIVDDDGAPVTSGVSGNMDLYYLDEGGSAITAVATTAVADQGGGDWGPTYTGAQIANPGLYRFNVAALTVGSQTLVNQGGLFIAGDVPSEWRTLRTLLTAIYQDLEDGILSSGTGGTNTLTDSRRSATGQDDNEWIGSELLILGPTLPATNPLIVDSWVHTTGAFTVKPNTTLSGSYDYLLVNRDGAGYSYARVREVLDNVIGQVRARERAADAVSLTVSSATREYALSAGWRVIDSVQVAQSTLAGDWTDIAPAYWHWDAGRRVLRDLQGTWPAGKALRISGLIDIPAPRALGALVSLPFSWVRDAALAELLLGPGPAQDPRRAAVLFQRAQQLRPRSVRG